MALPEQTGAVGNDEITFAIEELFYSRTDKSGIILSGNSVFQRVSIYGWNELSGRPHKIVRHPDMPRAVFFVLWDTIKKGKPVGAYVKNRAKDGRFYWVFAIATPTEDGYLSVRLKPTSGLLAAIKQEYPSHLAIEQRDRCTPADSARLLVARLAELGFSDYAHFMAKALSSEIDARNQQMGRTPDKIIRIFRDLVESAGSLMQQAKVISAQYEKNQYVSRNLQILAAHLGQQGATIDVISNNYELISAEIKSNMTRFVTSAQQVFGTINDGLFLVCTAKIQQEVSRIARDEPPLDGLSQDHEAACLEGQHEAYRAKAVEGLRNISRQTKDFREDCFEMGRLAGGLRVTSVMGRMECARLPAVNNGLEALLGDLDTFQEQIAGALKQINFINQNLQRDTEALRFAETDMCA
jgi:PAS fold